MQVVSTRNAREPKKCTLAPPRVSPWMGDRAESRWPDPPTGSPYRARLPSWAMESRPATATRPAPQSPGGARPVRLLTTAMAHGRGADRLRRVGLASTLRQRARHGRGRAAAVRADLRQRGRSRAPRMRAGRPIARKAGGPIRRQARHAKRAASTPPTGSPAQARRRSPPTTQGQKVTHHDRGPGPTAGGGARFALRHKPRLSRPGGFGHGALRAGLGTPGGPRLPAPSTPPQGAFP
jgi:hypothetical protein